MPCREELERLKIIPEKAIQTRIGLLCRGKGKQQGWLLKALEMCEKANPELAKELALHLAIQTACFGNDLSLGERAKLMKLIEDIPVADIADIRTHL